jgi:hypothetical protein
MVREEEKRKLKAIRNAEKENSEDNSDEDIKFSRPLQRNRGRSLSAAVMSRLVRFLYFEK